MNVALFVSCLTDTFAPRAGIAVVRVLEHLGHTVAFPDGQTCCGQPMHNNGFEPETRAIARHMLDVFEGHERIVTPSGSCAAMVRLHYTRLFDAGSADERRARALAERTWEFMEFLDDVLGVDIAELGATRAAVATGHASCHLRELGRGDELEDRLRAIEGVEVRNLPRSHECCGFGGTFAVKYPSISGRMVRDKADAVHETGAEQLVCNDAGCAMNIAGACRRAGHPVAVTSFAEVLAEGLGLLDSAS